MQKEQLGELHSERLNRIRCETQQIVEHWYDRLVIPFVKLAERYLSGHLDFHLHVRGGAEQSHISGLNLPRQLLPDSTDLSISHDIQVHDVNDQHQVSMLVDSVHVMDDPQGVARRIGSVVRLQTLDSCESRGIGDALYFSAVTAQFSFCRTARFATGRGSLVEHRELDLMGGLCLRLGRGQLPCEVIESGSKMVNDFTSEHLESRLNSPVLQKIYEFLVSSPIFIGNDWLSCRHIDIKGESRDGGQKLSDLPIEVLDILFGPL